MSIVNDTQTSVFEFQKQIIADLAEAQGFERLKFLIKEYDEIALRIENFFGPPNHLPYDPREGFYSSLTDNELNRFLDEKLSDPDHLPYDPKEGF